MKSNKEDNYRNEEYKKNLDNFENHCDKNIVNDKKISKNNNIYIYFILLFFGLLLCQLGHFILGGLDDYDKKYDEGHGNNKNINDINLVNEAFSKIEFDINDILVEDFNKTELKDFKILKKSFGEVGFYSKRVNYFTVEYGDKELELIVPIDIYRKYDEFDIIKLWEDKGNLLTEENVFLSILN